VDYVVTSWRGNIVYEKEPANGRARAVDVTAAVAATPSVDPLARRAEKMGQSQAARL